jgi:hypothetical protein
MKDTEPPLGKRAGARASSQARRQQLPLQQPHGPEHRATSPGNRADGRLTPSGDYTAQIVLASWALRELNAQRRLQSRRVGPQTS